MYKEQNNIEQQKTNAKINRHHLLLQVTSQSNTINCYISICSTGSTIYLHIFKYINSILHAYICRRHKRHTVGKKK